METPPPPVSPPCTSNAQSRTCFPGSGAPQPTPGGLGYGHHPGVPPPAMPTHGIHLPPPPHHRLGPSPPGPHSPPARSSTGGSLPPSNPSSPGSYHSHHSGHSMSYGPPAHPHAHPHGMPPFGGPPPHIPSPSASGSGMNTPSPPPSFLLHHNGAKVTPDAAARVARAKATGEPPIGPPTWRRMPCKARSVPEGHTAETAYLTIPPNAQHGLVLACSHPQCRQSGKRFRFCAICDLPVAKRNFLKRHSHGLVSAVRSPRTDDDDDDENDDKADASTASSLTSQKKNNSTSGTMQEKPKKDASMTRSNSDPHVASSAGASAPTSKSAFSGSQYKRPREAGTTPPRDSDMDREGRYYSSYGHPIHHAMSWPPHAEGDPVAYHPGVDANGRDAAARLGLSPYGYPHGHPTYNSPPGPSHHPMHHIPSQGMHPHLGAHFSPHPTDYEAPSNAAGAFRGIPPNHDVRSSCDGTSPRSDDFEPPQPEYTIMRLSRREREWLQLYRCRPKSSDREATNDWVNKCLSCTESLAESHDEHGGGVETILCDRNFAKPSTSGAPSTGAMKATESDEPANVSNDFSSDLPEAADDLDLSPCQPRKGTGDGSLSTLSMTGQSVTDLLEHGDLMGGEMNDMPIVADPGKQGNLKMSGSASSGDVSPISDHGAEDHQHRKLRRGSLLVSPEGAPSMPALVGGVRDSLQRAKIEGERVASGRNSVRPPSTRPTSPLVGADTPVNMDSEPSWGCSFLPPLCGAFNM